MSIKLHIELDKYSFESENMKIVFSEPNIQPWDEYGYCKNERGILYYYYGVESFIKKNNKWVKFFELGTYDFPQILVFEEMLKIILGGLKNTEDYQKIKVDETGNSYWLIKTYDIDSFSDDYYAVKHEVYMVDGVKERETYSVIVGKPFTIRCDEVQSLEFKQLSITDLETIYKCVKGFIDYTIKKNNEQVIKHNRSEIQSWFISDGKLYKMTEDGSGIDSIYIVGDKIDGAKVLCGDLDSCEFYSKEYSYFMIDSIEDDGFIISSGIEERRRGDNCRISKPKKINISVLISMFEDMSDERLGYGEEEIILDFISILSEGEKEEFKKESVDFLYNKWKEAILNRTWMCRDEHNLPKRVKDTGNHENVYVSIRVIVEEIKKRV